MTNHPLIFCAIDTPDLERALTLAKTVGPVTGGLKLGLEFVYSFGPQGIEAVQKACPEAALFLDLKLHDIPNTVAGAIRTVCSNFAPAYLNVHAAGGQAMMEAAKEACSGPTKLLAVTILTSLNDSEIAKIGYEGAVEAQVEKMALLTQESGLDGVVCSSHEIRLIRETCGPNFKTMVPGIRPEGAAMGDQKRVMTPRQAIQEGAAHLVIGRPITGHPDPAKAAQTILDTIAHNTQTAAGQQS